MQAPFLASRRASCTALRRVTVSWGRSLAYLDDFYVVPDPASVATLDVPAAEAAMLAHGDWVFSRGDCTWTATRVPPQAQLVEPAAAEVAATAPDAVGGNTGGAPPAAGAAVVPATVGGDHAIDDGGDDGGAGAPRPARRQRIE